MSNDPAQGAARGVAGDFLKEAAVFFAVTLLVVFKFQEPRWLWVLLPVLIAARFSILNQRHDGCLFLAGMIVGGGADYWMVWKGICRYAAPTLLPVEFPEWMLLFWGEVFLVLSRLLRLPLFQEEAAPAFRKRTWNLLLDVALLAAFQCALFLWAANPGILGVVFSIALLLRLLAAPPAMPERRLLIAILVLAPSVELLLILCGLYAYQNPSPLFLPPWLWAYWLVAFLALKGLYDLWERHLKRRHQE